MSHMWKSNAQGETKTLRRRAIDFSRIVGIPCQRSIKIVQNCAIDLVISLSCFF
jgi:hypothetical protein